MTSASFLNPLRKRGSDALERTVSISGRIEEIKFPKAIELFTGFAVVRIAGYVVAGQFPFLETSFKYNLVCAKQDGRGPRSYRIVDYQAIPYEPIPLTVTVLERMLRELHAYPRPTAMAKTRKLLEYMVSVGKDAPIEPDWLLREYPKRWVLFLAQDSMVFKYSRIINLGRFWSPSILTRLTIADLDSLSEALQNDPFRFCFRWLIVDWNVPELTKHTLLDNAEFFPEENRISDQMARVIDAYHGLRHKLERSRTLWFTLDDIRPYNCDVAFANRNQIFVPRYERCPVSGGQTCYYIYRDLEAMRELSARLQKIFNAPRRLLSQKKKPPSGLAEKLTLEQRSVYKAHFKHNLIILLGDGGCGKTLLGKYIFDTYRRKGILAAAAYNRVAANLKKLWGKGVTLSRVVSQVRKQTAFGLSVAKHTEVAIIDEISTVTLDLLNAFLKALPNLCKLILIGDDKQMPTVETDALLHGLMRKYDGGPLVHRLTRLMRTGANAETHKRNLEKLAKGDYRVEHTSDLSADHPFIVHQRTTLFGRDKDDKQKRIEALEKDLRPVLALFNEVEDYMIVTQKNTVRMEINQAVYNILRPSADEFNQMCFYVGEKVIFTETDSGSTSGPAYLRSWPVNNQEMKVIERIYDIFPFAQPSAANHDSDDDSSTELDETNIPIEELRSTSDRKKHLAWHRMIEFADGSRINLRHYSIKHIIKGNASTTAGAQGSERPCVIVYIHQDFTRTLTNRELYTALSRGKRIIVICNRGAAEDLSHSDIAKILSNKYREPRSYLVNYLPDYVEREDEEDLV